MRKALYGGRRGPFLRSQIAMSRFGLESNEALNRKFAAIMRKLSTHDKYFTVVFDELKKLTSEPTPTPRRQIGFTIDEKS